MQQNVHTSMQHIVPIDTKTNNTKKINISQLKKGLSSRNLIKTGRKVDLLERLINVICSTANISIINNIVSTTTVLYL